MYINRREGKFKASAFHVRLHFVSLMHSRGRNTYLIFIVILTTTIIKYIRIHTRAHNIYITYICILYIYIERERERERLCVCDERDKL